jgi:hypothetical protein
MSNKKKCDHGVVFDRAEADRLLTPWEPLDALAWIIGNPARDEVRRRFPRLDGVCPKGCGFHGIAYASVDHYRAGDW